MSEFIIVVKESKQKNNEIRILYAKAEGSYTTIGTTGWDLRNERLEGEYDLRGWYMNPRDIISLNKIPLL